MLQLLSSLLRQGTNAKVVHSTGTRNGSKKYEELHKGPKGRKAKGSKGGRVHERTSQKRGHGELRQWRSTSALSLAGEHQAGSAGSNDLVAQSAQFRKFTDIVILSQICTPVPNHRPRICPRDRRTRRLNKSHKRTLKLMKLDAGAGSDQFTRVFFSPSALPRLALESWDAL